MTIPIIDSVSNRRQEINLDTMVILPNILAIFLPNPRRLGSGELPFPSIRKDIGETKAARAAASCSSMELYNPLDLQRTLVRAETLFSDLLHSPEMLTTLRTNSRVLTLRMQPRLYCAPSIMTSDGVIKARWRDQT